MLLRPHAWFAVRCVEHAAMVSKAAQYIKSRPSSTLFAGGTAFGQHGPRGQHKHARVLYRTARLDDGGLSCLPAPSAPPQLTTELQDRKRAATAADLSATLADLARKRQHPVTCSRRSAVRAPRTRWSTSPGSDQAHLGMPGTGRRRARRSLGDRRRDSVRVQVFQQRRLADRALLVTALDHLAFPEQDDGRQPVHLPPPSARLSHMHVITGAVHLTTARPDNIQIRTSEAQDGAGCSVVCRPPKEHGTNALTARKGVHRLNTTHSMQASAPHAPPASPCQDVTRCDYQRSSPAPGRPAGRRLAAPCTSPPGWGRGPPLSSPPSARRQSPAAQPSSCRRLRQAMAGRTQGSGRLQSPAAQPDTCRELRGWRLAGRRAVSITAATRWRLAGRRAVSITTAISRAGRRSTCSTALSSGAMSLHGPHHVAQKSTSTGRSACARNAPWLTPQLELACLRLARQRLSTTGQLGRLAARCVALPAGVWVQAAQRERCRG